MGKHIRLAHADHARSLVSPTPLCALIILDLEIDSFVAYIGPQEFLDVMRPLAGDGTLKDMC